MSQAMRVLTSQATTEWYTPPAIIALVRDVLGQIDLDPASHDVPQQWIKAQVRYTIADDGLTRPWQGRVFLNPPFDAAPRWLEKLYAERTHRPCLSAVVLVNSAPGYKWWEQLLDTACLSVLLRERLAFVRADGTSAGRAKKGQTIALMAPAGCYTRRFCQVFRHLGRFVPGLAAAALEVTP